MSKALARETVINCHVRHRGFSREQVERAYAEWSMDACAECIAAALTAERARSRASGPYSYEPIAGPIGEINFRVRDSADNRIATCYVEENARHIVDSMNRADAARLRKMLIEYVRIHSAAPADSFGADYIPCDCALCDDARALLSAPASPPERPR